MIDLTDEQTTLLDGARSFARKTAPGLEGAGDTVTRARNLFTAYARAGYHALLIERKAGGMGLDYLS
ncbi:MAG: acyl-CoA dehydrogenase family protein, partial [Deltaproteobacteria bacterium]|nr:acyl-CoA dehydrogenase family protein [Deltaproteobacteria bacterium]